MSLMPRMNFHGCPSCSIAAKCFRCSMPLDLSEVLLLVLQELPWHGAFWESAGVRRAG